MKCREAQYWLYAFRPNTSWPADLVGHLQQCPKCRRLHTQLKQIDQGIGTLTSRAGDPSAKEQLLARLEHTPQAAAHNDVPPPSFPWLRVGGYLTAAAALIALGWFLGGRHEPSDALPGSPIETVKTLEVFRDKIVLVNSSADRNLFAALLQRNARLVQAAQSEDRVEALLDMADDCRRHALTLIEQGPRDSLPMTIELYAQLLREGVLVQL